jgi:hypothetical protein
LLLFFMVIGLTAIRGGSGEKCKSTTNYKLDGPPSIPNLFTLHN